MNLQEKLIRVLLKETEAKVTWAGQKVGVHVKSEDQRRTNLINKHREATNNGDFKLARRLARILVRTGNKP